MTPYLEGLGLLFSFYFEHIPTLRSLPSWLRNPQACDSLIQEKVRRREIQHRPPAITSDTSAATTTSTAPTPIVLSLPNGPRHKYNRGINTLAARLRQLHPGSRRMDYKTTMLLLFAVRMLTVFAAFATGDIATTFGVSALQFVIAPYSLFVSFTLAFAMGPPHFIAAYSINFGLKWLAEELAVQLPVLQGLGQAAPPTIAFTTAAIASFFLIDFAVCCYCHFFTDSITYTWRKTGTHMIYGFLNCKTYYCVLFVRIPSS